MNYKNISATVLTLLLVFFFGWLFFFYDGDSYEKHNHTTETQKTTWTCSMHPQIKQDKAGKCPICAMDLVPLNTVITEDSDNIYDIQMSEAAAKLADIQTIIVKKGNPIKEIHLQGKIQADERKMSKISARFGGRIERLYVNYTGQEVKKGELLAEIYSPELITAQKELLEAAKYKTTNPAIYKAAISKLELWDITEQQIANIENKGIVEKYFNILSPMSGTVSMRQVESGDYVNKGKTLFKIIDLNNLWVLLDAYERDLPWIKTGDNVKFRITAIPGKEYNAKVSYIDPFINAKTRIAQVRLEIPNAENTIKPQMFVKAIIESNISINDEELLIPKSSILWTGKRAVVYVKDPHKDSPIFTYREITLGSDAGSSYIVKKGLQEGEEIAVNGVFKIDAAAQLRGLTSMMNPAKTETIEINQKFRDQLTAFYMDYLKLKDAFITSDYSKTSKTIHLLHNSINKIDMKLLKGDVHMKWMEILKELNKAISDIVKAKDIESQRKEFADLSTSMFEAIKTFGINETSYYLFCPMADENKGSYWLNDSEQVRNPYFGDEMLECGEVKETVK